MADSKTITNSRWFPNLKNRINDNAAQVKKAVTKNANFLLDYFKAMWLANREFMTDPLGAFGLPTYNARVRKAYLEHLKRTGKDPFEEHLEAERRLSQAQSSESDKANKSVSDSSKGPSDSGSSKTDLLKDLLPLLALGGGGGLGIWGLTDLFSEKKSKTSGIIKTLLGLLLAGAALYPMLTGKSLTDLLPGGQGESSKQNKSTNK